MGDTIKWGIMGCGKIAHKFCEALSKVKDSKLTAVAATDLQRASAFGTQYGIDAHYGNYEALAKDPNVDVVYIANSHPFHIACLELCLNNGKAVLCEKPLVVNAKQASIAINLAKQKGLFLMEAMWTRFLPAIQQAKKMVDEGTIGEVRLIQADLGFKGEYNFENRLYNPHLAGGALLDVGVYPLYFAYYIIGQHPIASYSTFLKAPTGVDELSSYMLSFPNGATAMLSGSVGVETPQKAVIAGTLGKLTIPKFWCAEKLILENNEGKQTELDFPFDMNGFEYEIREVVQCLQKGEKESPIMPLGETLAITQLMESFRASWGLVYPFE